MENKLRVALVQYDIAWEDKASNMAYIEKEIEQWRDKADLILLPEMCTTGVSYRVEAMGEEWSGATMKRFLALAKENDIAICGSFLCLDNGKYYNRAFFVTPTQSCFYDKKHLFGVGSEGDFYSSGNEKIIIHYRGLNILPLVCYDLRFPVWSRNRENEYDLLLYVANWPEGRKKVWNVLLQARAIENMCYVAATNRIGRDGNKLSHAGKSMVVNPRGEKIMELSENKSETAVVVIDKDLLIKDRLNFPVWKDADDFEIK